MSASTRSAMGWWFHSEKPQYLVGSQLHPKLDFFQFDYTSKLLRSPNEISRQQTEAIIAKCRDDAKNQEAVEEGAPGRQLLFNKWLASTKSERPKQWHHLSWHKLFNTATRRKEATEWTRTWTDHQKIDYQMKYCFKVGITKDCQTP